LALPGPEFGRPNGRGRSAEPARDDPTLPGAGIKLLLAGEYGLSDFEQHLDEVLELLELI
jgi:hypothetical protein